MNQDGIPGGIVLDYGHKMDCEMNIIHEKNFQMEFDSQNAAGAIEPTTNSPSTSKETTVLSTKIKRSKSLDNLFLKTAQDLNRNSSTLEFPSMLSRFSELQFNE